MAPGYLRKTVLDCKSVKCLIWASEGFTCISKGQREKICNDNFLKEMLLKKTKKQRGDYFSLFAPGTNNFLKKLYLP